MKIACQFGSRKLKQSLNLNDIVFCFSQIENHELLCNHSQPSRQKQIGEIQHVGLAFVRSSVSQRFPDLPATLAVTVPLEV